MFEVLKVVFDVPTVLLLLLLSVGLPVANAPDVLQTCGLLYYPYMFQLSLPVVSPRDPGSQSWSYVENLS